LKFIPKRFLY